ncbi:MAG TPA: hypothetical protein VGE21_11470 [Flavobacteriales bacterium]
MLLKLTRSALVFGITCAVLYAVAFMLLCRVQLGNTLSIYRSAPYYSYDSGTNKMRFHAFDTAHRYDVLVLGSSHAYRGYDPALFRARGLELYNLGSSGQTPLQGRFLMEAYVDSGSTRLVIMDLYNPCFMDDGFESTSLLTRHVPSDRVAWNIGLAQRDLRALNMLMLRSVGTVEAPLADTAWCYSGYCPRTDSMQTPARTQRPRPFVAKSAQLEHFRHMLAHCREQRLPLVLVSHYQPSTSDRAAHLAFHDLVMQEIAPYPEVRYLDLAYAHQANDLDHFYDLNHLNQAGVDLFNAQLIDSLSALGLVPH